MRLKEYFPPLIVAILILTLVIVPATAELKTTQTDDGKTLISNGTYWISWNPIGDHIVGDQFFINGTTNLSAGTEIYLYIIAPTGGCHTKICNRKSAGTAGFVILKPGTTNGINTISLLINTTDLQSNQYIFQFMVLSSDNPEEVDTFYQPSTVDSSILLYSEDYRSMVVHSNTTHPDTGISYWISVSDVVDYTRPCYDFTGTTNLPVGEILSYSSFLPVEFGPDNNLDPIRNVQGLYRSGIVVPGEKSGINRFIIPINTSNLTEWINVIIWNPRYNASVSSDSLSTTTDFRPSTDAPNVSTTCSITQPATTPALPLSFFGIFGAFLVFFCIYWLVEKKNND
jgi:hypothetical protein